MAKRARVGILGASGYAGAELLRLLVPHPRVEIALLTADRKAGQEIGTVFPQFADRALPKLVAIDGVDWAGLGLDLVFCGLPHGTTQKVIQALRAAAPGTKVADLSADFRLTDPAAYARWYGHEHFAPELQNEAVYGLVEIYRRDIRDKVMPQEKGKFLIMDIESGDYEVDEDDLKAEAALRMRRPNGVFFGLRIGYTTAETLAGTMEEEGEMEADFVDGGPVITSALP